MTHGQLYPMCTLPRCNNLPWLSKNLQRAMKKWNKRNTRMCETRLHLYSENCKQSFFARNINNGERFWKTMKYLRKEHSTIPILQLDGKYADNELDKANVSKDYFSTCFNVSLPPLSGPYGSAEHLDLLGVSQE